MKRLLSILFLLLVVVFAAAETVLPRLVGDAVAQGMRAATGSNQVTAAVQKRPALLMLGGAFDKITVTALDAKIDKLTFRELRAMLTDVQLDRDKLWARQAAIERVRDVELTGTITQDELARYLNQTVKGVRNAAVVITPGKMQVTTTYSLGGLASMVIALEGKVASDGQRIKFVTERFFLNNMPVGGTSGSVLAEIPLLDLKKLPFGVIVRDIVMENGQVTISADNRPR
ncbi:hypothetical protein TcarDRAFT_0551 [Thermosinus carboxydivorans Nor1]|uniref:DUF2993 domain-containing protein n=1 Tax=Thermosinus carboxydivorans Nor1 TaxID=401526 RepID=A1HT08_9FIRM|nr:DUF2993 domain-containing protein [Thermosinus carboxydivorans]EAX46863.1 hypothetical protein TcarDRAFT_0551 [Thermosinus carboxydivorans Nor1]